MKGNSQAQMYVLLYTCLKVHAIHLDVISDMSSEFLVKSFQNFVNR